MDLGLSNRVVLVTGGSRGIGRAIAEALIAEGARVAISARTAEEVEETASTIGATPFVHDSAEFGSAPELIDAVEAELGPIEGLVCNTGGPAINPDPLAYEWEQWESAYRTLVLGQMAMIEHILPRMRERGWGRVLSISSTAVREPTTIFMLSSAHRASLLASFKVIARDVAVSGVTLNTIMPGRVSTERLYETMGTRDESVIAERERIPAGRPGTVREVADLAAFLCSDRASYVTGQAIAVDGGLLAAI